MAPATYRHYYLWEFSLFMLIALPIWLCPHTQASTCKCIPFLSSFPFPMCRRPSGSLVTNQFQNLSWFPPIFVYNVKISTFLPFKIQLYSLFSQLSGILIHEFILRFCYKTTIFPLFCLIWYRCFPKTCLSLKAHWIMAKKIQRSYNQNSSQGSFTSLSLFLIVNSLFIVPVCDTPSDCQFTSLLVGCLLFHMKAAIITEEKIFL